MRSIAPVKWKVERSNEGHFEIKDANVFEVVRPDSRAQCLVLLVDRVGFRDTAVSRLPWPNDALL